MAIEYSYSMNGDYMHSDARRREQLMHASALRVRKCMFPEFTFEETVEEDYNHDSFLHVLAEPSCSVRDAVVDLLNVPDEAEQLGHQLATLIPMMNSGNPSHVADAVRDVYLLSKTDSIAAYLASNEQLIDALVNAARSNNLNIQRDAVAALSNLAHSKDGRLFIFRTGGIAELIRMLSSPDEKIRKYAVNTLHNLLLYLEPAKDEIIALGGLKALLPVLVEDNPKLQAMTADCVYLILLDRPDCKHSFLLADGPKYLVHVLNLPTNYFKLIYAVARCIRSVSTEQSNKKQLVSLGCLESLHAHLSMINDSKRKLTFLHAIRNLSDAATTLDSLSNLICDLLSILKTSAENEEEIISSVCGILSNLTCNNVQNKQTVCEKDGIRILVQIAGHYRNIEDITEPALCTLRHCTVRHPLATEAQTNLRLTPHGYQIILSLLSTRRPPIVKAALGVARNCAIQETNLRALINETVGNGQQLLPITIEVLVNTGDGLAHDFDGLTEGVSLLELVETAVSVLHQLAREPMVADIICANKTVMNILINLLGMEKINNNDDLLVLREVLGLLYQLTKTTEGARSVKMCGVIPFVVDAYNSPNNSIAAYATVILRNLGVERPSHNYNSHSSTDTLGSHGRIVEQEYRGTHGWVNDGLEPELYNEIFNTLGEMKHDHIEGNQQGNSWFDTDL
ncbi:Armadillo segment polarity protein [Aphelenchoides besseyi]|nr:Armadillo segment polarity protein [Aphelenchoides besseyi]